MRIPEDKYRKKYTSNEEERRKTCRKRIDQLVMIREIKLGVNVTD